MEILGELCPLASVVLPRRVVRGKKNPLCFGFANRLRRARKASGLSLAVLARQAAVGSAGSTSALERGDSLPRVDTAERLACALHLTPALLAFGIEHPAEMGDLLLCEGLPQRLREGRLLLGLSQRELERRADIAVSGVRNTEMGHSLPRLDTVEKLANALGVSPAWLAYGLGPMEMPRRHPLKKRTTEGAPVELTSPYRD